MGMLDLCYFFAYHFFCVYAFVVFTDMIRQLSRNEETARMFAVIVETESVSMWECDVKQFCRSNKIGKIGRRCK